MLILLKKDDHENLRAFAITMMWVFPAVFMLLLPYVFEQSIPWWPALLSGVLAILYIVRPSGLYYPYRVWMWIALILSWLNTRIILGVAFYGLILPIGILLRIFGKLQYSAMSKNKVKNTSTFWIPSDKSKTKSNLKDPF